MSRLAWIADLLLGRHCPRGCGLRVWPKDYCSRRSSCTERAAS